MTNVFSIEITVSKHDAFGGPLFPRCTSAGADHPVPLRHARGLHADRIQAYVLEPSGNRPGMGED